MGLGVAGAIGAKLGRPDTHVVCVTGDGAFQMYMKEIPTAVQYGAPVLWIVCNNASLHWTKWIGRATGEKYLAVDFEVQPDFVAIARASGAYAESVRTSGDLLESLRRAKHELESGTPVVLDCVIETWDYPSGFVAFHREMYGLAQPTSDA
jgi:acetolactate synthase I/II/III large subunit